MGRLTADLFGPVQTLIMAAVLLVTIASLPAASGPRARVGAWVFVASLLGGVVLVGRGIERSGAVSVAWLSKIRKYAVSELNQATEKNVILIDGGSFPLNGIDVAAFHDELEQLGYSGRAVRLAMSACNHFERYRLYEDIQRGLVSGPKPGQRWVFLAEVHDDYDRQPLAQFAKNLDTVRPYHYLTPSNAWHAASALRSPDVVVPLGGAWEWPVFRHTLINAFNVGVGDRLMPESEVEASRGLTNDPRRKPRYDFKGLGPVLREAKSGVRPAQIRPWLVAIREARAEELWKSYISDWVYFGVPSTEAKHLRYVRGFCKATARKCIAPADPELLEALDRKQAWRNRGHMNSQGAHVYTRWLARELARLGVLHK